MRREKDLTGRVFGSLTVIGMAKPENRIEDRSTCTCMCTHCGETKNIAAYKLIRGHLKSCGCRRGLGWISNQPHFIDMTGEVVGRLTVIERVSKDEPGLSPGLKNANSSLWRCQCSCGGPNSLTIQRRQHLSKGLVTSCGCLRREKQSESGKARLLPNQEAAKNVFMNQYKISAKKRGYEFSLSKEQFVCLISQNCSYCDLLPERRWELSDRSYARDFFANGVDRKDNGLGYTTENSIPCCTDCNSAKGTKSVEEFKAYLIRIARHMRLAI